MGKSEGGENDEHKVQRKKKQSKVHFYDEETTTNANYAAPSDEP